MWKTRKRTILSLAFCLLAFVSCVGICSANQQYTISATQLEALQNHLNALEQNNSELERLLNESGVELTTASTALLESRNEISRLKEQLIKLQTETNQLSESLRIANEELKRASASFKASERERDRIEGRLRNQRTIWQIVAVMIGGVAIVK